MTSKFLRFQMIIRQSKILFIKKNLLVFNLEKKKKIQMRLEIHFNFLNQKHSMIQSTLPLLLERLRLHQIIKYDSLNAHLLSIFALLQSSKQKITNKLLSRKENHFSFYFQNVVIVREVLKDEQELKENEKNSFQIQFHQWKKSISFQQ